MTGCGRRRSAALRVTIAAAVMSLSVLAAFSEDASGHPATHPVTLEWVGDMALSSRAGLPPGGVARALSPVRGLLREADVTLGNLEGTLSQGGPSKCGAGRSNECFAFQAPPYVAGELRSLGFDLVNQANNHSLDYGPSGRSQTLAALGRAGLAQTGLPGETTILNVAGTKVAFLGFAPYPYDSSLLDIPAAQAMVRQARARAAIVVVIIHAGAEGAGQLHTPYGTQYYLGEDRGDARAFAHAVIEAGASVVFGSGPHVVRGVEDFKGHLIAYSLGNFVGYETLGGGGVLDDSAIMRVTLGAGGTVLAARWIPIRLRSGLPAPIPPELARTSSPPSRALTSPAIISRSSPSGLFHLPHTAAGTD